MPNKVKEKAKRTAKPKRAEQVRLKKTTLRMLRWADLLRALTPQGRKSYAQIYRDARRNGCSNRYIMGIDKYPTPEAKKQAEETEAEEAALAARAAEIEAADSTAHVASPEPEAQPTLADEHLSIASGASKTRRRKSRTTPQNRQAVFSFGAD
jgi:hypothetical protein